MNLRSVFLASILSLACGFWAAAAPITLGPGAPALCQTAFEPLVSVALAWSPKEALRQKRLMDKALEAVKPGAPGKRDVFILSAALGGEHVFDQEAASSADILAQHYASGRKTVLSNGAASLGRDRPAATPENFSAALAKIGEAMNPEDVLVLFLTSHGAHGKGAVIYETKRLQASLSPARLNAELDNAGIKNRVLIISACFPACISRRCKTTIQRFLRPQAPSAPRLAVSRSETGPISAMLCSRML